MSMLQSKLLAYAVASTGLASAVVLNAYNTKGGFYAASVAIGRSNASVMVLLNFAAFLVLLHGIVLKKLFFGRLRTIEIEHLYERSWFFLTETMLALTIFRDSFDIVFVAMFGLLLFLKCFHWISADRIDYMDQLPPPGPPTRFHIRMASVIFALFTVDLLALRYCATEVFAMFGEGARGGGATLLFASEFAVLLASNYTICAKYGLNLMDLRRARGQPDAPAWEEKSMYVFYVDLTYDAVRLAVYSTFFYLIFTLFGTIPLNQLHSLFSVVRSFGIKLRDLSRYRNATRNMDQRYPDATTEEIERLGGGSCVICREEMVVGVGHTTGGNAAAGGPNETPKKLGCGHVFHFHCLRSWLERQQSCPTCRRSVLESTPVPSASAAPPRPGQVPVPPGGRAAPAGTHQQQPVNQMMHPTLNIWNNHFLHPATVAAYPRLRSMGTSRAQHLPPARPSLAPRNLSAISAAPDETPSSPLPSVTPLSSQAPVVFSPISSRKEPHASLRTVAAAETPQQMAAAAAMRRLQKATGSAELSGQTDAEEVGLLPEVIDDALAEVAAGAAASPISYLRPTSAATLGAAPVYLPSSLPQDASRPFLAALDNALIGLKARRSLDEAGSIQDQMETIAVLEGGIELAIEKLVLERSIVIAGTDWAAV